MDPIEQATYYCLKLLLGLVIIGTAVYFMVEAKKYRKVYGQQKDTYIFVTFIFLAVSQFLFAIYETIWALYFVILTTEGTDNFWGKTIIDFYNDNMELVLKVCDLSQIFGYTL
jgi:hypothetical protein